MKRKQKPSWDATTIYFLRRHLNMTQSEFAGELGTRQQTISEWETGIYEPRGTSAKLLTIIAEREGFVYRPSKD